jgi:hypothetical protein
MSLPDDTIGCHHYERPHARAPLYGWCDECWYADDDNETQADREARAQADLEERVAHQLAGVPPTEGELPFKADPEKWRRDRRERDERRATEDF